MSVAFKLLAGWALCAERPPSSDLRILPIEESDGLLATLDSKARPGIMVELKSGESLGGAPLVDSAGLRCELYPFGTKEKPRRGMLVTCCVQDVQEAFASFGETLLEHRRAGATPVASYRRACEDFRKLTVSTLADQRAILIGVLGELITLERLLLLSPIALDAWMYPNLERNDFRMGSVAIEVKTSLRSQNGAAVIRVSAIDQLDPPEGGALFLRSIRLERNPGGEVSLSALETRLTHLLTTARADELRERLRHAGLPGSARDERFSILGMETFRVNEGFPRLSLQKLKTESLDEGVRRVSYDLDLAHAASCVCMHEVAERAIVDGVAQ